MNTRDKEQSLKLAENYFRDNNYSFAKKILHKIIELDKNNSKANELLAYIHGNSGKLDISFELLNVACNQSDCSPEALYYLGSIQLEKRLFGNAIETFKKSISKGGEFFEALHNLASAQAQMRELTSALINYQKCLKFGKSSHELFYNIARIYDDLKDYNEAIAYYDKAIILKPDFAAAWSNKGITLGDLKRYDESIAHFNKVLSLNPEIDWIYGNLVHAKMKVCSWSDLDDSLDELPRKIMANKRVSTPFVTLALSDKASLQKKSAEIYASSKYPHNPVLGKILTITLEKKIRIGYFSADFRNHPVSNLTAELFELHDKNKFETFAISYGVDDKSTMRSRLTKAFTHFIDVRTKSDQEIAHLARNLEIDIAIDLGGHTSQGRTGIFAHRTAPIQLSYIGYLGTMGAEYYDYLLADKTIIPNGSEHFYSEKIAYLPSYQVNDRKRTISEKQFTRAELGLSQASIIFCCFNNNYKILPVTFGSWMRILKAVDGSVLFVYADNDWSKTNLINEARVRGIDSSRLVFGERIPYEEYLARYRVCDLFLDTFPYNAGTTASDALWSGLPLITLQGESFASRVAASLLKAIDIPELITTNQEQYEALAIELALNPQKLRSIKHKLINNRLTTPLFDTPLFTKNLEAAYTQMYDRYQAGLKPEHIVIT